MTQKEDGRQMLDSLFGEGYSANRDSKRTKFNGPLLDFIEEVNFGRLWQRDGIEVKRRVEITIAVLVALNRLPQAKSYMKAALRIGTTKDELREIILHTAIYSGLPGAVAGFNTAEEMLRETGQADD